VGTPEQANTFTNDEGGRLMPLFVSISNPLLLRDEGIWTFDKLVPQLEKAGIHVPDALHKEREQFGKYAVSDEYRQWSNRVLRDLIQKAGYDGVKYLNRTEGVNHGAVQKEREEMGLQAGSEPDSLYDKHGSGYSYIAFEPWQVKSATANKGEFSKDSGSIKESAGTDRNRLVEHGSHDQKDHGNRDGGGNAATMTGDDVARVLADQFGNKEKGRDQDSLKSKFISSDKFELMTVPVDLLRPYVQQPKIDDNYAEKASRSSGPIIVDANKTGHYGYTDEHGAPDFLILDGQHRHNEAQHRGDETIQAYVGDAIAGKLKQEIAKRQESQDEIERETKAFLDPNNESPGTALRRLRTLLPDDKVEALRERRKAEGEASRASVTFRGAKFETGTPVTFEFLRNNEKAPNFGSKFQQDIEPAGRYVIQKEVDHVPHGWEAGEITFNKPLVLPFNTGAFGGYDDKSWKAQLSREYGGKTGKELSQALAADGYDGIVTVSIGPDGKSYDTREIIDLRMFSKQDKPVAESADNWDENLHPRDSDGKFAEKGSGDTASAGPESAQVWQKARDPIAKQIDEDLDKLEKLQPSFKNAREYRADAHRVMEYMNSRCLKSLSNVRLRFHKDNVDLCSSWSYATGRPAAEAREKGVTGFCVNTDADGKIKDIQVHVNGGSDSITRRHTYAHEFAHAVDAGHRFSNSHEWNAAWNEEIVSGKLNLSDYSKTKPSEGFAEFGRLVWTSPREAREIYPKCWKFWKDRGLV
jgi:hypothetical protein